MEEWEKIKNASAIFNHASCILFQYFNHGMKENIEVEKSLIIPQVVLEVFSCELGLKSLLMKEEISYNRIHKLYDLFKTLPAELQVNIQSLTETSCEKQGLFDSDFESNLMQISNMFIELRYYFEENEKNISPIFIESFHDAIKHFIGDYE